MTAIKFVPIPLEVATLVLELLREADIAHGQLGRTYPETIAMLPHLHPRAAKAAMVIGEAISIAGEHVPAVELLCAELLELIGRVSGRAISTIPGETSLSEATEALSDLAPVLGKVLRLPPVPERASAEAIDAAVARGLADMPGPIALRPFVARKQRPREPSYDELDTVDVWAVPHKGEPWCGHVVLGVDWDSPSSVRLFLTAKPAGEGEPF
jgi:hypothetical protein